MKNTVSVHLLNPKLRKKYLWPAIGLLINEAIAYKESAGSIALRGGIRNIPELRDFKNCFLEKLDGCLALDEKSDLVGFMLWTDHGESAFPDTPSYKHKSTFVSRYSIAYPHMVFIDLVIVQRRGLTDGSSDNYYNAGAAFSGMLAKAQKAATKLSQNAVCVGLVSPFNSYLIHTIQNAGYFLLLNISLTQSPYNLFSYNFDGHWIYRPSESIGWLPVILPAKSHTKNKVAINRDRVILELCNDFHVPEALKKTHKYATMAFSLVREKSLLTDRICGYLLSTTNFDKHKVPRRVVPLEQFNDMRIENRLKKYDDLSRKVQSAGYTVLRQSIESFLKSYTKKECIDIVDMGAGCSTWDFLGKKNVRIHSYDIPIDRECNRSPIDVLSFDPKKNLPIKISDGIKNPEVLILANLVARLFDYVSKNGRDFIPAEKSRFLESIFRYVAKTKTVAFIQESTISPDSDVDLLAISEWCSNQYKDEFEDEDVLLYWSAFWWYALAEKVVQPLNIESIRKSIPFLSAADTTPRKDAAGELRVSHVYTLRSSRERVYDVFFYALDTHEAAFSNFISGIVDRNKFNELLKNSISIFGKTRIVDVMREYQVAHLGTASSLRFVFVSYDERCANDVNAFAQSIGRQLDVVYVSQLVNKERQSAVVSSAIDLRDGDKFFAACSFFSATHEYLRKEIKNDLGNRYLLSITVGRFIEAFNGYVTYSTNSAIDKDYGIDEIMLAHEIQEQFNELDNSVEIKVRESLRFESRRAAASAILSRNFSHHIGSHVMPRANVNDIKKRLNILYEGGLKPEDDIDQSRDISLSVERLKTVLDDFIQKKADFLAEVTTDPNSSSDSKLLGRDILTPLMSNALLMDNIARNEGFGYPIIPPPVATNGEEIQQGWKQGLTDAEKDKIVKIKMDNSINGNNDRVVGLVPLQWRMRSTLRLSLCVRENGKCHCILGPDLPPYDPFYGLKGINFQPEQFGVKADCTHKDPMIAVPGMVGQFAIYGVLENIIRNAAKHGKKDDKADGLHIHMLIEDDGEDYYKLSIWDDRTEPDIIKITASIPNQPDVKPKERSLGEHLQAWAEADLIDPSGAVRRDAWGVAEIMICANLLAGRRQFDYQRDIAEIVEDYSPHLNCDKVTCEGVDAPSAESAKKRLIYRIRLLKAKRAVFVGKCFTDHWKNDLTSLKKEGVYAFESVDSLREFFKKSEACQAFQFAVFDFTSASVIAALEEKTQEEFLAKLPFRVFEIASSEAQAGGKSPIPRTVCLETNPFLSSSVSISADKLMELLWQCWIRDNNNLNPEKKTITNAVYLDCKSIEPPNNSWKSVIPDFNRESGPVKMYLTSRDNGSVGEDHLADAIHAGFFRHKTAGGIADDDMFEVFGKRNADCDMLLGAVLPTAGRPFWELPYAMAEAGLVRILVLDERMTERAMTPVKDNSDHGGNIIQNLKINDYIPCFWHLAQRAKVYIATHLQVGENADSMKPLHDSYADTESKHNGANENPRPACPFLKIQISKEGLQVLGYDRYGPNRNGEVAAESAPEFDIVVIHQGIIDTNKPKTEQGNDEEIMRHWILKTHPWLVVESGRGIPPGLQKKPVRFLSFSALDQTLALDGIGKLSLTRRLMALPRFGDNGGES